MATQKICDRCGNIKSVDKNELVEFFRGSIEFQDVDLCEDCFQIFAEFINKFMVSPTENIKNELDDYILRKNNGDKNED